MVFIWYNRNINVLHALPIVLALYCTVLYRAICTGTSCTKLRLSPDCSSTHAGLFTVCTLQLNFVSEFFYTGIIRFINILHIRVLPLSVPVFFVYYYRAVQLPVQLQLVTSPQFLLTWSVWCTSYNWNAYGAYRYNRVSRRYYTYAFLPCRAVLCCVVVLASVPVSGLTASLMHQSYSSSSAGLFSMYPTGRYIWCIPIGTRLCYFYAPFLPVAIAVLLLFTVLALCTVHNRAVQYLYQLPLLPVYSTPPHFGSVYSVAPWVGAYEHTGIIGFYRHYFLLCVPAKTHRAWHCTVILYRWGTGLFMPVLYCTVLCCTGHCIVLYGL
jgi:hypothetical protein